MTQNNTTQAARQQLAASFIARGFSVLILHDVSAGHCSCGDAGCLSKPKNQGKHPRMGGGWQHAGLTTAAAVDEWLARNPEANLGILTGPPSGCWVLDVDPDNGGDVALAALEREHGPLPYTYTVRTGSGGHHHYFELPEDFTPTSANRLPAGLDTRGANGQVVAPGSRTLLGEYWVSTDAPIAPAPAWLLEHIRPRAIVEPVAHGEPAALSPAAPLSPGDHEGARLHAYAAGAVNLEVGRLAAAGPGQRGFTAYTVACNLIELTNSPWARLDPQLVWQLYMAAAHEAMAHGGAFDAAEATSSWGSAARHIGSAGRVPPPPPVIGGVVDAPVSPAAPAAAESAPFAGASVSGLIPWPRHAEPVAQAAEATGSPAHAGSSQVAHGESEQVSAWMDHQVAEAVRKLEIRREAQRVLAAKDAAAAGGDLVSRAAELEALMLDSRALAHLPRLKPLVDGWLMRNTLARVNGPSGHGKSFVMIDLAGSVATGVDWHGHAVSQGDVWYMVAEGAEGVEPRVRAWEKLHGRDMTGVRFLPLPVQIGGPQWDALEFLAARDRPAMIIGDTQARLTVGIDENSATEMGVMVDALDRLRVASGACVLLVHHKGVAGDHGRGSSAVRGALQTELSVTKNGSVVTIHVDKQKDHEQLPDMDLVLRDQEGTGSVALVREVNGVMQDALDKSITGTLLEVARDTFATGMGGTKGEIMAVLNERRRVSKASRNRAWNELLVRKVLGKIHGTASYVYVMPDDRSKMIDPVSDRGEKGAFYAPVPESAGQSATQSYEVVGK